jgi:uncharacterized protein YheU (UPF0270 family)
VELPFALLAPETLQRLLEEFVTRDGTDNGDLSHSLADRVRDVQRQLERGEAAIDFDPETESCTVVKAVGPRRVRSSTGPPVEARTAPPGT